MENSLLKVWGIVLLVLIALIGLYLFFRPEPNAVNPPQNYQSLQRLQQIRAPFFNQPLDEAAAIESVNAYRNNLFMRSCGVLYDPDVILNYITNIYPELKRKMGRDTINYKWKLGFYWMITKGNDSINRLSFCVVPTMVSKTDPSKAIDYFKDTLNRYNHPPTTIRLETAPPGDSGFAYDEGQLWP